MADYEYADKTEEPCIPMLRDTIVASAMTDKTFMCVKNMSRAPGDYDFTVEFENTLSGGDETILDGLVDDCLGYVQVNRSLAQVIEGILEDASGGAQKARIQSFFRQYADFYAFVEVQKFASGRSVIDEAVTDTVLTTADRDDVMYPNCPADRYEHP